MKRNLTRELTGMGVGLGMLASIAGAGDPGVTDTEIKLGQSCAISGPAQALGTGMRDGLDACFARINAEGGIGGRKVALVTRDDAYEPDKAVQSVRALLNDEKVFLIVGEVGTPTATAVVPICEENRAIFWAPFTGAEFLRSPFNRLVVNVRASYFQETETLAALLVDRLKKTRIACFHQNDSYGQAGLKGIVQALAKRKIELVATGNYERNTTAVKMGLLDIRKENPEAVVMIGAYKACAEFIKLARRTGLDKALFCNVSFVGTDALCAELGEAGEGVIISQVVNFPMDASVPLVKEYQEALLKHRPDAKPGFVSLEGYMAGKLFCMAAKAAGKELTRDSLLRTLEQTQTFDLGGTILTFGEQDHQGMDQVFLTRIEQGKVVPLKE